MVAMKLILARVIDFSENNDKNCAKLCFNRA